MCKIYTIVCPRCRYRSYPFTFEFEQVGVVVNYVLATQNRCIVTRNKNCNNCSNAHYFVQFYQTMMRT